MPQASSLRQRLHEYQQLCGPVGLTPARRFLLLSQRHGHTTLLAFPFTL